MFTLSNPKLSRVLRVHDEPYRYFDDAQVHELLCRNGAAYLQHIDTALNALVSGEMELELPGKQLFVDPGECGDFRVMPCICRYPDRVVKTVKIVGTNYIARQVPDQITVGKAFALDPEENFIRAGFAGCLLSSARTGACAVTAIARLQPAAESLLVIGAGRVGFYAALFAAAAGLSRRILFHDRLHQRAVNAAMALQSLFPQCEVTAVAGFEQHETDVAILASDSREPFFGREHPLPALTISLGADTDWQRELYPELSAQLELFVDTRDSLNYGDLKQWQRDGLLDTTQVSDLFAIYRGKRPQQRALFVSTGSALFDNLTIDYLMQTAES